MLKEWVLEEPSLTQGLFGSFLVRQFDIALLFGVSVCECGGLETKHNHC